MSLSGDGIESVMEKIVSAFSGKALRKAQKKGLDRLLSSDEKSSFLMYRYDNVNRISREKKTHTQGTSQKGTYHSPDKMPRV
jgi:hypothetical protein